MIKNMAGLTNKTILTKNIYKLNIKFLIESKNYPVL